MTLEEQRRKWSPVEHRLCSEFIAKVFPGRRYVLRARLGTVPERIKGDYDPDLAERFFKITKKWADGIVLDSDSVTIIEAKVFAKGVALFQLAEYARLFPITPEFQAHATKSIYKLLACSVVDPDVIPQARNMATQVWVYRPTWILPILAQRYKLKMNAEDEPRRLV